MLHTFVRDDLFNYGVGEDGDDLIALVFHVVVETPEGRRFAHDHGFRTIERRHDPEEGHYWQRVDRAIPAEASEALRAKVERHLKAGGKLDDRHWIEIDPAYGSAAYSALDAQAWFKGRERDEARQAGENVPIDFVQDRGYLGGFTLPHLAPSDL